MQELLKRLLSELHAAYFKPNGFTKERQRFRRDVDEVMQEVDFQSSAWNSSGGPVTFYVNIRAGFADILMNDGKPALTGHARLPGLVPGAPAHYGLTPTNYDRIRSELLAFLPSVLSALPEHYEEVRKWALAGGHSLIPGTSQPGSAADREGG
jgi:hypothetical protein